jgi:osmotically-inducible protein OsmY
MRTDKLRTKKENIMLNPLKLALWGTALSGAMLVSACGAPLLMGAAGTAAYVGLQNRPTKQVAADSEVKVRVMSALGQKDYRFLGDVGVDVFYNDVLVTGVVPTRALGEEIIEIISRTQGVRKVYNELFVGDAYTTGQRAKDAWIAAQIKPRLIGTKGVYPLNYMISVVNNHVYALGSVSTADERNNVLHILRTTNGVTQVHDYLVIIAPTEEGRPNVVEMKATETPTGVEGRPR